MKTVFISYSHQDFEFAEYLAQRLSRASIGVWLDRWEMKIGDSITHRINEAIKNHDFVVTLLSPASINSRWVNEELGAAMQKSPDTVLPVILPDLKSDEDIPVLLRDRLYADFRNGSEVAIQRLLEVLRPGTEVLRAILDPTESGRVVVLTGTSINPYHKGDSWSKAPAGSVGAQFAIKQAIEGIFDSEREVHWNFSGGEPLDGLQKGDNVITIGSPKVNKFSAGFLVQCDRDTLGSVWYVGRSEWRSHGNFLAIMGLNSIYRPTIDRLQGQGTGLDFGLVVWGTSIRPHNGMTLITGGCHTGATHAAAYCATSPDFYVELLENSAIRHRVESRSGGLWAIIEVNCTDFAPDLDTIRIRECGTLVTNTSFREEEFNSGIFKHWTK